MLYGGLYILASQTLERWRDLELSLDVHKVSLDQARHIYCIVKYVLPVR
jgi:hypothetical protein